MTGRRHGIATLDEVADEGSGVLVDPKLVCVHRAARKQQGVVVAHRGVGDRPVDGERARFIQVVLTGLDLAVVDRKDLGLSVGPFQCFAGLLELNAFDSVGGEERDPLAQELWRWSGEAGGMGVRAGCL